MEIIHGNVPIKNRRESIDDAEKRTKEVEAFLKAPERCCRAEKIGDATMPTQRLRYMNIMRRFAIKNKIIKPAEQSASAFRVSVLKGDIYLEKMRKRNPNVEDWRWI